MLAEGLSAHVRGTLTRYGMTQEVTDMTSIVELVRALHIGAGALGLVVFWIPMVLAKGGAWHRRVGWLFVAGMGTASVSGGLLCSYRLMTEIDPERLAAAFFLLFISVLTGAATWKGVRVLRFKNRRDRHVLAMDLGMAGLLAGTGLLTLGVGVAERAPLFVIFGLIGLSNGVGDLRYWLRPPTTRMHWWFEHMNGMITTSIAALTAFAVQNAARLGLDAFGVVVWLAPTLVLVPVNAVWQRYYRQRFAPKKAQAGVSPAAA